MRLLASLLRININSLPEIPSTLRQPPVVPLVIRPSIQSLLVVIALYGFKRVRLGVKLGSQYVSEYIFQSEYDSERKFAAR